MIFGISEPRGKSDLKNNASDFVLQAACEN